jgi:hypothetical protein
MKIKLLTTTAELAELLRLRGCCDSNQFIGAAKVHFTSEAVHGQ